MFAESCDNLYGLQWDQRGFERHGRKYVIRHLDVGQQWVAKLSGVMRGSQEREHYWCGEQLVRAWQMMEGRRAFYECRLEENGHWVL